MSYVSAGNSGVSYAKFRQKAYTLRNRVSYVQYIDKLLIAADGTRPYASSVDAGSFYSYDIHGNVDTLVQFYRSGVMGRHVTNLDNRYKLMAYNYDLISGKVNEYRKHICNSPMELD